MSKHSAPASANASPRFEEVLNSLMAEYNPQTATETLLVQNMARYQALVERALQMQEDCLVEKELDQNKFSLFIRYQTVNQRAFHTCLNDLTRLQKQRKRDALDAEQRRLAQYHRPLNDRIKEGDLEAIQIALEIGRKPEELPWHIRKMLGFLPQNPLNLDFTKVKL